MSYLILFGYCELITTKAKRKNRLTRETFKMKRTLETVGDEEKKGDEAVTSSEVKADTTKAAAAESGSTEAEDVNKSKHPKLEDKEVLCAICHDDDKSNLLEHGCKTCVKSAWQICGDCHRTRLSRTCPICNSDYEALPLYAIPLLPCGPWPIDFKQIADIGERYKCTMFFRVVIETLGSGTSAIWDPQHSVMHFILPTVIDAPQDERQVLVSKLPMTADQIIDGNKYLFDNQTWTKLEDETEGNEDGDDVTIQVGFKELVKIFASIMKIPGSVYLTECQPEEWIKNMDDAFLLATSEEDS